MTIAGRLRERLQHTPALVDHALPQSAVLVALDDRESPTSVVLTQRASHLRLHAGEVAFPGGKCESGDKDFWDTALREAAEEIELPPGHIRPLGHMRPLVTRTGIQVTPCVGMLEQAARLTPNPEEIDAVFEAPLAFFADPDELHFDVFDYGGRRRRVPRFQWREYSVWGITAAILVKLVNLALDADLAMEDYWQGGEPT
jgi:8-oxo-dGTP pyrophosphatase MutT (NUDIX family)